MSPASQSTPSLGYLVAPLTLFLYLIYLLLGALTLLPSCWLLLATLPALFPSGQTIETSARLAIPLALTLSAAYGVFLLTATLVLGLAIRLLCLGIKPGRYPVASLTFVRWLCYSGLYNLAIQLVLPMLRMSLFTNAFYRLVGCRLGRGVVLNSWTLPDAFLLTLGDGAVVGARAQISCHAFQGDALTLQPVVIGHHTLIGANCYIAPGCEIGSHCVLGVNSQLRPHTRVPDRTHLAAPAALPLKTLLGWERELENRHHAEDEEGLEGSPPSP